MTDADACRQAWTAIWNAFSVRGGGDLEWEHFVDISVKVGLIQDVPYDPAVHRGDIINDPEPEDLIWVLTERGIAAGAGPTA